MLEAGMQQGSLIRSRRTRGPAVWQFRWADRGPFGKRIYRTRLIGTVCQYPDADCARKSVAGLLPEINTNGLKRYVLPMTIAEVCNHFIQRELSNDPVQGVLANDADFSLCYRAVSDANVVSWTKTSLIMLITALVRLIRADTEHRDGRGSNEPCSHISLILWSLGINSAY